MKKLLLFGLLTVLLTSCVSNIPLSADYWNKQTKVGIWVNVNPASKFREGSQGLLDLALTSGDKYQPVLAYVEKNQNPKQNLIDIYTEALKAKGKDVVLITDSFDYKTAAKFDKSGQDQNKKFAKYDLRALKAKYGIDEVLFTEVNYGLMISYYSMIETGRSGYSSINSKIVNLTDNSLIMDNYNTQITPLKGKWDVPPAYENVSTNVKTTLDKAYEAEKALLK